MVAINKNNFWVIMPAAGLGSRMQADIPKQYLPLLKRTVLEYSLLNFVNLTVVKEIVLALNHINPYWATLDLSSNKKIQIIIGAEERYQSVWRALQFLKDKASPNDWVLVHDAVRPCLHPDDLHNLIEQLQDHPVGGLLATPVRDTLKQVDKQGNVIGTVDRTSLWSALTPQMFRFEKLYNAMQYVIDNQLVVTDEAAVIELMGEKPLIVAGRQDNIKITYPADLLLAEKILLSRADEKQGT